MRLEGESENVEDRRSLGKPAMIAGGGIGTVVIIVLALLFGKDPTPLLQQQGGGGGGQQQVETHGPVNTGNPEEDALAKFVSQVLKSTEDVWEAEFRKMGKTYQKPTLVLFRGQVESACGSASAAVGPFYCPGDSKLYIDLAFYDELKNRFKAPGDFAQAYVIAHEVGHHVQNLLGISDQVHRARGTQGEREANQMSVRLELQADFLAGMWAYHAQKTRKILDGGDLDEALNAASAIGDDRLQKQARGRVVPDSFTHGSSEQRRRWFRKGFETGDFKQGDTFNTPTL